MHFIYVLVLGRQSCIIDILSTENVPLLFNVFISETSIFSIRNMLQSYMPPSSWALTLNVIQALLILDHPN